MKFAILNQNAVGKVMVPKARNASERRVLDDPLCNMKLLLLQSGLNYFLGLVSAASTIIILCFSLEETEIPNRSGSERKGVRSCFYSVEPQTAKFVQNKIE